MGFQVTLYHNFGKLFLRSLWAKNIMSTVWELSAIQKWLMRRRYGRVYLEEQFLWAMDRPRPYTELATEFSSSQSLIPRCVESCEERGAWKKGELL
jgi:hypothetical protein